MHSWLTQWILHHGAGFMPQTAVPAIDPRAPSSQASRGIVAHASPRRGRARRAVVVTMRPALSGPLSGPLSGTLSGPLSGALPLAGRRLDGVDVDADSAARVRLRIDPADASRTRICGRMADVCDALDALIAREAARDATPALSPVLSAALSAASPGA